MQELGKSLWQEAAPHSARAPLRSDLDVDVAIIGAGFTGLWTAYYLRDSGLSVAIIEASRAGFGASGRNGGWCSGLFPVALSRLERMHGLEAARAMQRALEDTVDEVGRVIAAEDIDCDWAKGGTLTLARTPRQLRELPSSPLSAAAAQARCGASNVVGAAFSPHCAVLHPMKLVTDLAKVVAYPRPSGDTRLFEGTRALSVAPGLVTTSDGLVRAKHIVDATEAYSGGPRRVPIYSLMIATEPLPSSLWDTIGLAQRETFTDGRRLVIYGQRTADDRLTFGGRGAPYHFGSAIRPSFDQVPAVHAALERTLIDLFPQLDGVRITHRWGGPLGLHRDWHPSVNYDSATGLGSAGGYVGDGVAASNLAGRTLADLIAGKSSELTQLPWVNHRSRRWEPEPLRWLGINAALAAVKVADHFWP